MKIYARQIEPEFQTSPLEYGDFPEDIIIDGNPNLMEYKTTEYNTLRVHADDMVDEWHDRYYHSVEDLLRDYGIEPAAGVKWYDENYIKWREILEDRHAIDISEDEFVIEGLNLITGGDWKYITIRGCGQSDWNYCYFDSKKWSDDALDALEVEYFNTGSEWIIHDGDEDPETPEDIDGYSVYCTDWGNDGIRRQIAEAHGGNAEDVILYKFDGYTRSVIYKEVTE